MGNAATKVRKTRAKPKHGKQVNKKKIESAKNTGILSLKESKLKEIPNGVLDLTNLKTLDLSVNELTCIPEEISRMATLKTLHLKDNNLGSVNSLEGMSSLVTLSLDNNSLSRLSDLPSSLIKLSLSNNQFKAIPEALVILVNLEVLDLSSNLIDQIGFPLDCLNNLRELNMDDNVIKQISPDLAKCKKLKMLSLRRNQITALDSFGQQTIPEDVLLNSAIDILNLEGNLLTKLELVAMKGFQGGFETRRKQLKDKEIHGGLQTDVSICGLD